MVLRAPVEYPIGESIGMLPVFALVNSFGTCKLYMVVASLGILGALIIDTREEFLAV